MSSMKIHPVQYTQSSTHIAIYKKWCDYFILGQAFTAWQVRESLDWSLQEVLYLFLCCKSDCQISQERNFSSIDRRFKSDNHSVQNTFIINMLLLVDEIKGQASIKSKMRTKGVAYWERCSDSSSWWNCKQSQLHPVRWQITYTRPES